jgi:hypothetical protein
LLNPNGIVDSPKVSLPQATTILLEAAFAVVTHNDKQSASRRLVWFDLMGAEITQHYPAAARLPVSLHWKHYKALKIA